jgi:hypothetical protein
MTIFEEFAFSLAAAMYFFALEKLIVVTLQ